MRADMAAPVEDYKTAMRHVVSPVAVVTWRHAGGRAGMTLTAICSATTDPPTLVVCIRADNAGSCVCCKIGYSDFAVNVQGTISSRYRVWPDAYITIAKNRHFGSRRPIGGA